MALTKDSYVLGFHGFFFREGDAFTIPGAGTCGRAAKPGATDTGWLDLGVIEDASIDPIKEQEYKIFAPTPGVLRMWRNLSTKLEQTGGFKCKELSAFAIEVLFRATAPLTSASTQFNPLSGKKCVGWLKYQSYDQNDAQRFVADTFCELKVKSAVPFGGNLAEVDFSFEVLHSTLNTATL